MASNKEDEITKINLNKLKKMASKSKNKLNRYRNLIKVVKNYRSYILRKLIGFNNGFKFEIIGLGDIYVPKNMLGPFRENFLDDIYFKHIPKKIFEKNESPVVIDIGSNAGYFSLAMFWKKPKAKIYGFEPHPFCYKTSLDYARKFKRFDWNLYNLAVSNNNDEIYLNTNDIESFTTVASVFKKGNNINSFAVKAIKFSSFIEENKIKNIDFIKLDCEGSEYDILYSMSNTEFKIIKSLCIETHNGKNPNQNLESLNTYIQNLGFKTATLIEDDYSGYIWAWKNSV